MERVRRLVTPGTRCGGRASMLVPALFLASSLALTAGSASAWSASHDDDCEACKARLERRAAHKAAKQDKQNLWVALDAPAGEKTAVDRWVTAMPKGDWVTAIPKGDFVFEWTQQAPAKLDFTEPSQPESRWLVVPTIVECDSLRSASSSTM